MARSTRTSPPSKSFRRLQLRTARKSRETALKATAQQKRVDVHTLNVTWLSDTVIIPVMAALWLHWGLKWLAPHLNSMQGSRGDSRRFSPQAAEIVKKPSFRQ